MGLIFQFIAGGKHAVLYAFKEDSIEFIDPYEAQNRTADFSLHFREEDMEMLVRTAATLKGLPPFGLSEHLDDRQFFVDTGESGIFCVDPVITRLFAGFEKTDAPLIADQWFKAMDTFYKDNAAVTPESIRAVEQLVLLCREAMQLQLDLLYHWSL